MKHLFAAALTLTIVVAAGQPAPPGLTSVGRSRLSAIYDVKADARYMYALERGILHVLDARDPAHLRQVGSVEFDRPRVRMALHHPYVYLTGFNEPLGVANVADPARPVWVRDMPEFARTASDGFEVGGDYGYLIRNGERTSAGSTLSLDVLDLSTDPARPRRTGTVDLGVRVMGEYGGMAYASGRLFVVVRQTAGTAPRSRLIVIDASAPAAPRIERTIFLPDGKLYKDVEVRGDLVYLLQPERAPGQPAGLAIYRMPVTGDLELLGEALTTKVSIPIDLIVAGDVAYATVKVGGLLATFDVSNPRAPAITHIYEQHDLWSGGLGMALVENRLYVSGDNGPCPILDVSTPRTPRLLGRYEFEGGDASAVLVERDLAIVTSLSDLVLYDVANPAAPRRVGRYKGIPSHDSKEFQSNVVVAANERRAFVTYESRPAQLVDLSDAARPRLVATFKPRGVVHASALTATIAVLGFEELRSGSARGGVEIVGLRDHTKLRSLATIELDQPVSQLALRANRLVTASSDGELTVIDLQNWTRPIVLGRLAATTQGDAAYVALSEDGRTAYVTQGDTSLPDRGVLTVIDVRDGGAPRLVGRLEIPISGSTDMPLAVQGSSVVIVAGISGGIALVDASKPTQPVLSHIQPLQGYAVGLALRDRSLLIAAAEDGLLIYRR